jgi:hypothetical protein
MAFGLRATGIDVAVHSADAGCGDPCHPGHVCNSCAPFWQRMQATGRFNAYVPPTFAGGDPPRQPNPGAGHLEFAHLHFRTRGSGS